jgi:hypothetical protein
MLARLGLVGGIVLGLAACQTTGQRSHGALHPTHDGSGQAAAHGTAQEPPQEATQDATDEADDDSGRGLGHRLLWYIPNRISDVLDIVRLRLRVGPGLAVGVRATELADVYVGTYASIFVGVPGPRGRRAFNWPFGFESKSGVEASVLDATLEGPIGPEYGPTEFGASLHLLLVGVDVGVDPLEIVDFALGLVTIDFIGGDDL